MVESCGSITVHRGMNGEVSMKSLVVDTTGNDLTYRIIGAAMKVHNQIGMGYKEEVYESSLEAELNQLEIDVIRQYPVSVEYEEQHVAIFYLDLFVNDQVVVEVKAFSHLLTNDERAQVINYLKATGASIGLLFNFGRRKLEYRRIFPGNAGTGPVQRVGRDDILRSSRKS